jgi:hypothetical protein
MFFFLALQTVREIAVGLCVLLDYRVVTGYFLDQVSTRSQGGQHESQFHSSDAQHSTSWYFAKESGRVTKFVPGHPRASSRVSAGERL